MSDAQKQERALKRRYVQVENEVSPSKPVEIGAEGLLPPLDSPS